MSNDKEIQDVIDTMLKQAGTPDPQILVPGNTPENSVEEVLKMLSMVVQNVEMGMVQLVQNQQVMGSALDACRLTIQMLTNILVETAVITEEDFRSRYKTDVIDKMQAMQEKMRAEMQKQMAEQQAAEEAEEAPGGCTDCKCENKCGTETEADIAESQDSDVVLASERGNVINFDSKKETE